jgi:hypothetical protein
MMRKLRYGSCPTRFPKSEYRGHFDAEKNFVPLGLAQNQLGILAQTLMGELNKGCGMLDYGRYVKKMVVSSFPPH